MKEMIKKLQKRSNKKGFTLVEIIVVLVILAILAAIAVPAVLGYVNDAKESKYISEARAIYIVVQTEEAKWKAENNKTDADLVKDAAVYTTIATKAQTETGLSSIAITPDENTAGKYTFTWTSDSKNVNATVEKNKEVTINSVSQ